MKKSILVTSLLVCSLSLLATPKAQAVETKGSINFLKNSDESGSIHKPEIPEKEIEPEGGNSTIGDLRIQHVPDFNFGNQENAMGEQLFNPTLEKYTFVTPVGPEAGEKYLPHFIQITDVRGKNFGWNLRVSATVFENNDGDQLPGARITFNQGRLSNDVYSETEIASKVTTFTDNAGLGNVLEIPTDVNQARLVMATKGTGQATSTDGSRTSIVLDDSYDKDKLDYLATDLNSQVVLRKTNTDIALVSDAGQINKLYTSKITWTLTDGI